MSEKKGLFGFFKGWAAVSEEEKAQREHAISQKTDSPVATKRPQSEITTDIELFCVSKLEELIEKTGFSGKVRTIKKEGSRLYLDIFDTGEDVSRIIGKSGANLESLQVLLRHFVIRKFQEYIYVVIDADDYLRRRVTTIKSNAIEAAKSLIEPGDSIKLGDMSSSERSVIHMLFEEDDTIMTESAGRGRSRRVVLIKK